MKNNNLTLISTVGVEIEVQHIPPSMELTSQVRKLGWSTTGDASVESFAPSLFDRPIHTLDDKEYPFLETNTTKFGVEIISTPSKPNTEQFIYTLNELCSLLSKEGKYSPRASLHVHVNVGDELNLLQLKSIIRWATRVESLFFRVGSFGGVHRGYINNYNYCRPITLEGPLVVKTRAGNGQLFNVKDLIASTSEDEFWEKYGDVITNMDDKYHPIRYHWINLFSIWKHRTLEFRVANLCLDPYLIRAFILLCQATTHCMFTTSYSKLKELNIQPINSIFKPDETSAVEALKYILNEYEEGDLSLKDHLFRIFNISNFPVIEQKLVYSHLIEKRDRTYFANTNYCPAAIDSDLVSPAIYLDVHNDDAKEKHLSYVSIKSLR